MEKFLRKIENFWKKLARKSTENMPGKNEIEESDGEGDVSERSANSSDTDDDSEMDVTECEKRRAECMDNLSEYHLI